MYNKVFIEIKKQKNTKYVISVFFFTFLTFCFTLIEAIIKY